MRISALLSNKLYAASRASYVETSAFGLFAPSTARKMGSRPHEVLKRFCTFSALIEKPSSGV